MKIFKKILGTVIFLGIGVMLFMGISYLLRPTDKNFFRREFTGFYAEEEDSLDIVSLGSSALYFYLNNPYLWGQYGFTSYNLATPSQSNFFVEDLIDEILKTQSPQLIIVETRKFLLAEEKSLNADRFCFVHDNMNYSWNRIELINSVLDTWPERINAYFDIITYHDGWEELTGENFQYVDNQEEHDLKGWKIYESVKAMEAPVIYTGEETLPIPAASEEALIKLMEKCSEENIQVLFVATPWKISEKNQRKNRYLGELIEQYGYQFLDCNLYLEEIGFDFSKDFYNSRHTNMVGAEKVTKFIGNYIMENYKFATNHSEEVVAEWNEVLNRYNAKAEEVKAEMAAK